MTRPTLGRARWWVAAALALVGVFVLGATAVRFAPPGSTVAVWWPAAGLAVSFLLATARGPRAWVFVLGVLVSSAAANAYGGRPPLVALCFGVANAAEVAVVYGLLTRGGRRPALASMEDLWNLLAATLAGALVFGMLAGLTVRLGLGGPFLATASAVTASHAAAVLVFAPLGIAVGTRRTRRPGFEDLVQWVVVVGLTAWVFNPDQALPLAFLPIPVLVWGALRLGLRTVAIQAPRRRRPGGDADEHRRWTLRRGRTGRRPAPRDGRRPDPGLPRDGGRHGPLARGRLDAAARGAR